MYLMPQLPIEIENIILDKPLETGVDMVIRRCDHWFQRSTLGSKYLHSWPNPNFPWNTPIVLDDGSWNALFFCLLVIPP